MKSFFIFILLLLSTTTLFSDEDDNTYSKYIGAGMGLTTGGGLIYRYWPEYWGGQVVFTPTWDDSDIGFNLGLAAFRKLHETKYTRLFLYLATSIYMDWGEDDDVEDIKLENIEPEKENVWNSEPAIGFGPGLEIYLKEHIVLNVMFGYGLTNEGLGFTWETGIYYRF